MITTLEFNTDLLYDQDKKKVDPKRTLGKLTLVNFWSVECPTCEQSDPELIEIKTLFPYLRTVAVLSNQNEDPEIALKLFSARGYDEIWIDPNAHLAKEWQAISTPTVFLFDEQGTLHYHGAINDRTFRKRVAEVSYVANALKQLEAGSAIDPSETPTFGCAIVDVIPEQG